jgi:membrane peptidoglycan carboxypeptidase
MRALYDNVTGSGSSLQGGSTITQQFVRNYYANIGSQQTISRKLKEIFVAIKLARQKSKDWILTQYLNTVYFGNGAYGVEAAAQTFFGKHAGQLNVSQDAMIAAMLNAPGAFDPTPGSPGYQPLVARWQYVLQGMVTMGKLTQKEASAQKFPKVVSAQPNSSGWTGYNGYIMQAVYNELVYTDHMSKALIDNGGLHIVTTFSKPMMDALYATVNQSEKLMRANGAPLPSFAHVGAVLEQPGTGAIVAMYSGPSYSEPARYCLKIHCQVDMALGAREQVGSSFKPYVLATARTQGMNVKTSILDGTSPLCVPGVQYPQQTAVPATGIGPGACPTTPYGWHAFSNDAGDTGVGGPQSVVYSTAHSLNTAYTDLTHRVGTQNVINMAKTFGVDTSSFASGGSGLQDMVGQVGIALGTAALSVGEQASTFATLAADGQYVTPHVIEQVTQGTNLITPKLTHRQVLTPAEAADVNYPLSFVTQPGGTGTNAAMSDGRPVLGKTGTTSSGQSAFFLGAIPQYSLAIGMFTDQQNSSTTGESLNGVGGLPGYGGNWPAMIWHAFAEKEFAGLPIQNFAAPTFGGTTWNLVGPGASLFQPKPHPAPPRHPAPSPRVACTPSPQQPCGKKPPHSPPPNPHPTPTCTTALRCPPGTSPPPVAGPRGSGSTGTSPSALPAAAPARAARTRGSG